MNDSESCRALIPMEYNVTHGSNTIEVQYASQISISNKKNQLNNKTMLIPFHFLSIEDMNTIQKKERDTDHKLSFTQTICSL